MKYKNKRIAAVMMAAVLSAASFTGYLGEDSVYAKDKQEESAEAGQPEETEKKQKKKKAPEVVLPENLEAEDGRILAEIALPDGWSWADGQTTVKEGTDKYAARLSVDDETYEYKKVKGYNADGHYVERELSVAVKQRETEPPQETSGEVVSDLKQTEDVGKTESGETEEASAEKETAGAGAGEPTEPAEEEIISPEKGESTETAEEETASEVTDEPAGVVEEETAGEETDESTEPAEEEIISPEKGESIETAEEETASEVIDETADVVKEETVGEETIESTELAEEEAASEVADEPADVVEEETADEETDESTELAEEETASEVADEPADVVEEETADEETDESTELAEEETAGGGAGEFSETGIGETSESFEPVEEEMVNGESDESLEVVKEESNSGKFDELAKEEETTSKESSEVKETEIKEFMTEIGLSDVDDSESEETEIKDNSEENENEEIIAETILLEQNMTNSLYALSDERAAGDILVSELYVPDQVFRGHILKYYDLNGDGYLSETERYEVKHIYLQQGENVADMTGIALFPNLEEVYCGNSNLKKLDVSGNPQLKEISCGDSQITSLDVSHNPNLEKLYCYETQITALDVSHNPNLVELVCFSTEIDSINVTNNPKLEVLSVSSENVQNIDLSNNPKLKKLYCGGTSVSSLDLSHNPDLEDLRCNYTKLTTLDVSANTKLKNLLCEGNNLYSLDLGNNSGLEISAALILYKDIGVVGKEFNLLDYFPKLDTGKITLENGTLDGDIVRDIVSGNNVAYLYDCGVANGGLVQLKVVLFFQFENYWEERLIVSDCVYGEKLSISAVPAFGQVQYNYSDSEYGQYSSFCPTDAGTYWVQAVVSWYNETTFNMEWLFSDPVAFTIEKKDSSISITLEDMIYTGEPAEPEVAAAEGDGEISYIWYEKSEEDWIELEDAPADVGTYQVIAHMEEGVNYTESDSEPVEFSIKKAVPYYEIPENVTAFYGDILAEVELPDGFEWQDSDEEAVGDVGTHNFKATYISEDEDNYEMIENIEITVEVLQAENIWTEELFQEDRVYMEDAEDPQAEARFGEVYYRYCRTEDGIYTEAVPMDAGIWYVKAFVDGTENYFGLESSAVSFEIKPKHVDADSGVNLSEISQDSDVENLVVMDGEQTLVKDKDYKVEVKSEKAEATVIVSFTGNYEGEIAVTYTRETESETEPQNETESETEPQSVTEPETEPQSEAESETEEQSETAPETEPRSETESETEPQSEGESETELQSAAEPETELHSEAEPETELQSEAEPETEPQSETESETEPQSETESETEPQSETESETELQSETESETEPQSEPQSETEPNSEAVSESEANQTEKAKNGAGAGTKTAETAPPKETEQSTGVKTGDDTNVTVWMAALVLSAAGVVLLRKKKK